jgi:hypothetical protein
MGVGPRHVSENYKKMFIEIDDILVDIKALSSFAHYCNPVICASRKCCCQSVDVCVDMREVETIAGFMPLAAAFSKNLKSGKYFINVFEKVESNLFSIDQTKDDLCVFAYYGRRREVLCSLHAVAEKYGYKPENIKPRVCTLWPLALTDDKPCYLTVDDDAFLFPCNARRESEETLFDPSIAIIIEKAFGAEFLQKLYKGCSEH